MKARAAGSEDDFLKKKQAEVIAIIEHGALVSNFLVQLQERKEQERQQLRMTRKLQYVHRLPFENGHPSQRVLFTGSTRGLWS
jgi:hypothetical protein